MTLIRAETDRYDIVGFSNQVFGLGIRLFNRSQMNLVRADLQVNFEPRRCENKANVVPSDCVTLHPGTCMRRV